MKKTTVSPDRTGVAFAMFSGLMILSALTAVAMGGYLISGELEIVARQWSMIFSGSR